MTPVPLTMRQMSVAVLVSKGYTDKMIADELDIAERTVSVHVHRVGVVFGVDPQRNVRVQIANRMHDLAA